MRPVYYGKHLLALPQQQILGVLREVLSLLGFRCPLTTVSPLRSLLHLCTSQSAAFRKALLVRPTEAQRSQELGVVLVKRKAALVL